MAEIVEQNSRNPAKEGAAPSGSTGAGNDISAPQPPDDMPADSARLPSAVADATSALPAHLERLAARARTYVEAASSANTR